MGNKSLHKHQQNQQLKRFLTRFGQLKLHPTKTLHKINQISDGKSFLVKQITTNDEIQKENILNLIEKKMKSKSSYIVSLHDHFLHMQTNYCSNQFKVLLIFESIPKSLKDQIINRRINKNYFTEEEILIIIEAVIYGLIELNNMNHPHQSICSSKIMIDEKGYVRISDPWLSQQDISFKSSHYIYMSPEKLDLINNKRIEKIDWLLSDLFSLGMITLEILNLEFMDDMYYNNNKSIDFIQLNKKISSIRYQQIKRYVQMLLGNLYSRSILLNQFICKFPRTPKYLKQISDKPFHSRKQLEIDLPSSRLSHLLSFSNLTPLSSKSINNININRAETTEKVSSKNYIKQCSNIPQTKIFYTNKKNVNDFPHYINRTINQKNTYNNNRNSRVTTIKKQITPLIKKKYSYQTKTNTNPFVKIRVVNNFVNISNLNVTSEPKVITKSNSSNMNMNVYTNPGMGQIYIPNLKLNQNSFHQNGKSSYESCRSSSTNYLDNFEKIQKTQIKQKGVQNVNEFLQKNQFEIPQFFSQKKYQQPQNFLKQNEIINDNKKVINIQNLISSQQKSINYQKRSQAIQQKEQIKIQYNNMNSDQQNQLYLLNYDQNYKQQYSIKVHQASSSAEHTPDRKPVIHPNKYNSTILQVSQTDQSPTQTVDYETQYVIQQYGQGSKYEGQKKNKMKNGYGIFYYKDGGYYQGEWKDDRMHGMGKLYYNNDKLAYEGNWFMDEFHGFGKVYNDMPQQLDSLFDYHNFEYIEQFWEYYEGNLISDVKQGLGKLKLSNGQIFEGQFKKDKIDGNGRFFTKKGQIINGIWKNSKLVAML